MRIWRKENPDAKPLLNVAMSAAQLKKHVADCLRKSQALNDGTAQSLSISYGLRWFMLEHTKQPQVFASFSLHSEMPFVIVERLARPALADLPLLSQLGFFCQVAFLRGRLVSACAIRTVI